MQPESFVQLIQAGNARTTEEEWMRMVESSDRPLEKFIKYDVALAELKKQGNIALAETLAWACIESLLSRCTPKEALTVAGPFLQAVGKSDELRKQVCNLYKQAYEGAEGLEELLAEAGIEGGRPVRRALRTLNVCLQINEGDYLGGRDEDKAARIEAVDRAAWEYTLETGNGSISLGAVLLADEYQPALANEFRVLRHFAMDQLRTTLAKAPATIVMDLCREKGGTIESTDLEAMLVPDLMAVDEWKKWWTKARAAIKKTSDMTIEGRAPYVITIVDSDATHDDNFLNEFRTINDPLLSHAALEKHVRDGRLRKSEPSEDLMGECYQRYYGRAVELSKEGAVRAGLLWLISLRVCELGGLDAPWDEATEWFTKCEKLDQVFKQAEDAKLIEGACECLARSRPDEWTSALLNLLPAASTSSCDVFASRLTKAGIEFDQFESAVQRVFIDPTEHFGALLWLWNGPDIIKEIPGVTPVTLVMKILRTVEESRRSDTISKSLEREITTRVRAVLPAKKFDRFRQCVEDIEIGMAVALKGQLLRCEGLGRAAREDMLGIIAERFPTMDQKKVQDKWERTEILYVTDEGMRKKHAEVEHHVNVKMKENARAIGEAAERGDLSENSEYKFALEERDLLRARLGQMNKEMAMAKVLTAEDVPTDHLGVGSRAVFKHETDGNTFPLSFAGPWEAGTEDSWLNYKAPLAQSLMGMRIGESFDFDVSWAKGTFELVELSNAIEGVDSASESEASATLEKSAQGRESGV